MKTPRNMPHPHKPSGSRPLCPRRPRTPEPYLDRMRRPAIDRRTRTRRQRFRREFLGGNSAAHPEPAPTRRRFHPARAGQSLSVRSEGNAIDVARMAVQCPLLRVAERPHVVPLETTQIRFARARLIVLQHVDRPLYFGALPCQVCAFDVRGIDLLAQFPGAFVSASPGVIGRPSRDVGPPHSAHRRSGRN